MEESAAQMRRVAGLAHVASLSFLATRLAPPLGFGLSLAGGVALARASAAGTLRVGYATAWAAIVETVAIVGPNRLGGPITQALTAPAIGRLEALGRGRLIQIAAAAALRFAYNAATTVFFIAVVAGGVGGYAEAYGKLAGWLPGAPAGALASLLVTTAGLVAWALFAASVQVITFAHAFRRWPAPGAEAPAPSPGRRPGRSKRFDPRVVVGATAVSFAVLLLAMTPWVLVASAISLLIAWALCRPDLDVLPSGLAIASILGILGAALGALGGGGAGQAVQLGARASLLVLWATWLRAASGDLGFREVARRALWRLRAVPAAREAGTLLAEMGAERRIGPAARQLTEVGRRAPRTPMGIVDAVIDWIAVEAHRFRASLPAGRPLRLGALDVLPPLLALLPLMALAA
jgi:hypothetical protein